MSNTVGSAAIGIAFTGEHTHVFYLQSIIYTCYSGSCYNDDSSHLQVHMFIVLGAKIPIDFHRTSENIDRGY